MIQSAFQFAFLRKLRLALLLPLSVFLFAACSSGPDDQLSKSYYTYARAVMDGRGYDAAKLASTKTLKHYETLNDLALHGGRGMYNLSIYDELSVYYLRAKYEAEALNKFSGRDVMNVLIKANMVGVPDMARFTVGEIGFDSEDKAWAPLYKGDQDPVYEISFVKENGKWKIDNRPMRSKRNDVLLQRLMQYGGSREEVISELLKAHGVREGLTPAVEKPLL